MRGGDRCTVALTPDSKDQLEAASTDSVRCGPDQQHVSVEGRRQVSAGIFRQGEDVVVLGATRAPYAETG
tara:strand:+ start:230 stop:439 length:210 start_codon:yes stop_codon:yes gene_type:complete